MLNIDANRWYTKNELLNELPIGITTYKNRIKRLQENEYKNFTKFILKELNGSNLKQVKERVIHGSILNELFGEIRTPNIRNYSKISKWILLQRWDWFCNVVPSKVYDHELKRKMEYFYQRIKETVGKKKEVIIFYTIEKNTNDDFFHSHFLIKTKHNIIDENLLLTLLGEIAEENNRNEKRIYVRPYNHLIYKQRGVAYSNKKTIIDYGFLK